MYRVQLDTPGRLSIRSPLRNHCIGLPARINIKQPPGSKSAPDRDAHFVAPPHCDLHVMPRCGRRWPLAPGGGRPATRGAWTLDAPPATVRIPCEDRVAACGGLGDQPSDSAVRRRLAPGGRVQFVRFEMTSGVPISRPRPDGNAPRAMSPVHRGGRPTRRAAPPCGSMGRFGSPGVRGRAPAERFAGCSAQPALLPAGPQPEAGTKSSRGAWHVDRCIDLPSISVEDASGPVVEALAGMPCATSQNKRSWVTRPSRGPCAGGLPCRPVRSEGSRSCRQRRNT